MEGIYLLLGSNLGDKRKNLIAARDALQQIPVTVNRVSSIYKSEPWGMADQDYFLNQVIAISTELSPFELLDHLEAIESTMGKKQMVQWGPRNIDIDILFFGTEIVQNEKLIIPHAEIANRAFTLIPMAEIGPDFMHPVLNKTISQLLNDCPDSLSVTLLSNFD